MTTKIKPAESEIPMKEPTTDEVRAEEHSFRQFDADSSLGYGLVVIYTLADPIRTHRIHRMRNRISVGRTTNAIAERWSGQSWEEVAALHGSEISDAPRPDVFDRTPLDGAEWLNDTHLMLTEHAVTAIFPGHGTYWSHQ